MLGRSWLQPRDHDVAARTITVLCAVAAAVTIIFTVADERSRRDPVVLIVTVLAAIAVIGAGWSIRFLRPSHTLSWAICPFAAIAVIVVLDLFTTDATVAGQVFFFFPALYGASQLRRPGAICVSLATVIGEIIVVVAELHVGAGVADAVYMSCALLTTVALLVFAGERQDALVGQLKQQAAIDPLTGLATRRVLDQAAQTALTALSSGPRGEGTALILIDVDDFKSVNDRYGHPAGDEVLIRLAALLTEGCREGDIVSRMGGDEIAMLLPGCSRDSVARRADQILWDVRATTFLVRDGDDEVHPLSISVSAGLAHAPTHAIDVQAMYATADAALYAAKRGGRNRVVAPPNPEQLATA